MNTFLFFLATLFRDFNRFFSIRLRVLSLFLVCFSVSWSQSTPVNSGATNSSNRHFNEAPTVPQVESKEIIIRLDSEQEDKKLQEIQESSSKKMKTKSLEKGSSSDLKDVQLQKTQYNQQFQTQKKNASTQLNSRSPSDSQQQEMNQAVDFYRTVAPESFEFHYFTYTSGNYNTQLFSHLESAYRLKPENTDVLIQLVGYYLITENKSSALTFLKQLKNKGVISEELLNYNRNLMQSALPTSSLLIHGVDDGLSSAYLQLHDSLRTDLQLISLDYLQSETYRSNLQKLGYKIPEIKSVDVSFLESFCKLNVSKNLHVSMTFPKPYLTTISNRLNVYGLTFLIKSDPIVTFEENENLWLDFSGTYLAVIETDKGKKLLSNYLPMLLYLRGEYERAGNSQKVIEVDQAIDEIGIKTNNFSKVNSLRGRY